MLSKCLEYFDKHSSEKTFLLKRGVKATWKGLFACFNYLWISIGGFIFCCYKKAVFRSWKDYQLFKKKMVKKEHRFSWQNLACWVFILQSTKRRWRFCVPSLVPLHILSLPFTPPPHSLFPLPYGFWACRDHQKERNAIKTSQCCCQIMCDAWWWSTWNWWSIVWICSAKLGCLK